jgi:hypothetical protein
MYSEPEVGPVEPMVVNAAPARHVLLERSLRECGLGSEGRGPQQGASE